MPAAQRVTARLKESLKACIPADLSKCREYVQVAIASLAHPNSMDAAVVSLQITRFFLYRHDLSISCWPQQRHDALNCCVSVAKDTAHYLQRSMQQTAWKDRLRDGTPSFLSYHLRRCALVLCTRLECDLAFITILALAVTGDVHEDNACCRSHLTSFLTELLERLHQGDSVECLEADETIMAHVNADLHVYTNKHCASAGGTTASMLHYSTAPQQQAKEHLIPAEAASGGPLVENETQERWNWDRILHVVRELCRQQRQQQRQQQHQLSHAAQQLQPLPPGLRKPSAASCYRSTIEQPSPPLPTEHYPHAQPPAESSGMLTQRFPPLPYSRSDSTNNSVKSSWGAGGGIGGSSNCSHGGRQGIRICDIIEKRE